MSIRSKSICTKQIFKSLSDPSFQGVNRLFLLSFENEDDRKSHSSYYLPKVTTKDYNFIIDGKIFYDQPINIELKT